MEAWGHVLTLLLEKMPNDVKPDDALLARAKQLDKNYILTRCPNGFEQGAPVDFYTIEDTRTAIAHAEAIIEFL